MNYRHAFHAGNHADLLKHITLVAVLRRLLEKPAPLQVLDTHAGAGVYDLASDPAIRTGEAADGIQRLRAAAPPELADFLSLTGQTVEYPGSPEIARRLLRPDDLLVLCELHPEDHAILKSRMRHDPRVHVHCRDGYEALKPFLPPKVKRGLVLLDPPYESPQESERVATALIAAQRRWPSGVYLVWYPITQAARSPRLVAELVGAGMGELLQIELTRAPGREGLAGSGVLVVNPPWQVEATLRPQLQAVADHLGGSLRLE